MKKVTCFIILLAVLGCAHERTPQFEVKPAAEVGASCQSLDDACDKDHPCCGNNKCVPVGSYGSMCEKP
jgi:hypothetical protein